MEGLRCWRLLGGAVPVEGEGLELVEAESTTLDEEAPTTTAPLLLLLGGEHTLHNAAFSPKAGLHAVSGAPSKVSGELPSQAGSCVQERDHVLAIDHEEITRVTLIPGDVPFGGQQRQAHRVRAIPPCTIRFLPVVDESIRRIHVDGSADRRVVHADVEGRNGDDAGAGGSLAPCRVYLHAGSVDKPP